MPKVGPPQLPGSGTALPGDPLDTGTGGFPLGGSPGSNLHTFAPKRPEDPEPSPGGDYGAWSAGSVKTYLEPQDISSGTKKKLSDYITSLTQKNKYPVKSVNGSEASIRGGSSKEYAADPLPTTNEVKFVDQKDPNYPRSRTDLVNSFPVTRGRQPPIAGAKYDGNTLLQGAALPGKQNPDPQATVMQSGISTTSLDPSSPVSSYSSSVLSSRFGQFRPGLPSYENYSDPSHAGESDRKTVQFGRAQFAKKYPMGRSLSGDSQERNLTFGQLSQIGPALTARAGTEKK